MYYLFVIELNLLLFFLINLIINYSYFLINVINSL